eukprot:652748-Rhodomonas_salina.2
MLARSSTSLCCLRVLPSPSPPPLPLPSLSPCFSPPSLLLISRPFPPPPPPPPPAGLSLSKDQFATVLKLADQIQVSCAICYASLSAICYATLDAICYAISFAISYTIYYPIYHPICCATLLRELLRGLSCYLLRHIQRHFPLKRADQTQCYDILTMAPVLTSRAVVPGSHHGPVIVKPFSSNPRCKL